MAAFDMYLNQIKTVEVDITHDGSGILNPYTATLLDSATLGGKNILIVGFSVVNRHASAVLTYTLTRDGKKMSQVAINAAAQSSYQINDPAQLYMLGFMVRDGQGNYSIPHEGSKDMKVIVTSSAAAHDATFFLTYIVNE